MTAIVERTLAAGNQLGRYFGVVSLVPSGIFLAFTWLLFASGGLTGSPNWSSALTSLSQISIGGASLFAAMSIGLGVVLHPLQFGMTQLLEGYWGTTSIGRAVMQVGIKRHRVRQRYYKAIVGERRRELDRVTKAALPDRPLLSEVGDVHIAAIVDRQQFLKALDDYPSADHVLPTRLGNVLRHYEDIAGKQYGLDAILVAPPMALVASPEHVAYLNDTREQLDAAVRLSILSGLATAIYALALLTDGLWLLLSLGPYLMSYLSYRGAVISAHDYGTALARLIDLNRFRLYEALHVPLPNSTVGERAANKKLTALLGFQRNVSVHYLHTESKQASPTSENSP